MKKYIVLLLVFFVVLVSSCYVNGSGVESCISDFISENSIVNAEFIESNKYYRIHKNGFDFTYEIFNSKGQISLTETTDRPVSISMLNNRIIDISVGMGTGMIIHKYYDVSQDVFSEEFSYVIASKNDIIAYIYIPNQGEFEDRRIIIQNIFNKDIFSKEFELEFSEVDNPVIEAIFSDDSSKLSVKYLSGKEMSTSSAELNLK